MLEIRKNSYINKASILHIDRREEFKRKLVERKNPKKIKKLECKVTYDDKF